VTRASEPDPTLTDVFGPEKARQLRWALWVRRQFTATSLTVIGLVAGSAWAYIGHLREQIAQVTTRVVVLETEVIPDKDLKLKVAEHEARLRNLEDNYQFARDHAADPPARGRVPR
jgi:hypothetical protein